MPAANVTKTTSPRPAPPSSSNSWRTSRIRCLRPIGRRSRTTSCGAWVAARRCAASRPASVPSSAPRARRCRWASPRNCWRRCSASPRCAPAAGAPPPFSRRRCASSPGSARRRLRVPRPRSPPAIGPPGPQTLGPLARAHPRGPISLSVARPSTLRVRTLPRSAAWNRRRFDGRSQARAPPPPRLPPMATPLRAPPAMAPVPPPAPAAPALPPATLAPDRPPATPAPDSPAAAATPSGPAARAARRRPASGRRAAIGRVRAARPPLAPGAALLTAAAVLGAGGAVAVLLLGHDAAADAVAAGLPRRQRQLSSSRGATGSGSSARPQSDPAAAGP